MRSEGTIPSGEDFEEVQRLTTADYPFAALVHRGIWHVQLTPGGKWVTIATDSRETAILFARMAVGE